jgi:dihydropteroate synthase
MLTTMAAAGVDCVLMHWRAHSADMSRFAAYDDVVADVVSELRTARDLALAAGVDTGRIVVDPGLGFAKDADHNWALLRRLDAIAALGHRVLIGASRKRFLGSLLAGERGERPPEGRDVATAALSALAAERGVWGVRVHDAAATVDAIRVARRWHGSSTAATPTFR